MSSAYLEGVDGLRALAHPARLQILDLFRVHEQLTASECAARLGLSPKSCSYHLHILAAQGLVAQSPPNESDGRQRPWRRTSDEVELAAPDAAEGPDLAQARAQAMGTAARHDLSLFLAFLGSYNLSSPDWGDSTTVHTRTVLMSPTELRAWGEAVEALTRKHVDRAAQAFRRNRRPVRLTIRGFPQPIRGDDDRSADGR